MKNESVYFHTLKVDIHCLETSRMVRRIRTGLNGGSIPDLPVNTGV